MFWWIRVWPFISSAAVQLTFILLVHSSTTGICYGCHCRSWWTHQLSDHQSRVETPSECVYEPHGGDMHQHVCVCVRRLASAGLLTRGYHILKGLKCQDFTVSRTMLSTLILASAKEIEWLTAAVVSLRPEWCIFLLSCSRSIEESMFLAGIYILYGIFIFYRKKSGKWQV